MGSHYQLNDTMRGDDADADYISPRRDDSIFQMTDEDKELLRLITENVNRANAMPKVKSDPADDRIYSSDSSFNDIYSRLTGNDGRTDSIKFSNPGLEHAESVVDAGRTHRRPYAEQPQSYVDARSLNNVISNKPVLPPDKDDIIGLVKDMQKSDRRYYSEILGSDPEAAPIVVENQTDEYGQAKYRGYMSDFMDELTKKMHEEDERQRREEEEFKGVYDKIHDIYPYLSREFMKNVYFMKDSITQEYPLNIKVVILHRIQFREVESLRQFVEIALNHNYAINADENKLIVDAFKQHINVDGKIITSIFEVANQSALLGAEYVGYRVLFEEDSK